MSASATEAASTAVKQQIDLAAHCRTIIDDFKDDQQNISDALRKYKIILTHYVNNDETYNDEDREYILNEFLEISCITLMSREYDNFATDWNIGDDINGCCHLLISIAVPLIKYDDPLSMQIIYHCTNRLSKFYTNFGHDWRQKRGSELTKDEIDELTEWRNNEIQSGMFIDYLLGNRWRYGNIREVTHQKDKNNTDNDYLLLGITPLMDGMYPTHSRNNQDEINEYIEDFILSKQTYGQIAKPLTKSIEQQPHMVEWRKNLRCLTENEQELNDNDLNVNRCDVLDSVHKWYTCTIIEEDKAANRFKIGYDGWSSRYDEWIFRDEMKLQPFMNFAKGGRESQGVTGSVDELALLMEDEEDDDNLYAVWRGRLNHCSYHLVDILNEFGKHGGFDVILERLSNRSPTIPMENLCNILSPLSKSYRIYSKKCAETFIKPVIDLTFNLLETLREIELKDLTKNYLSTIVESLQYFLRRFYCDEEIVQKIEIFELKMALKRLKCVSFDRRIDGVSFIADLCSRTRRQTGYGYTMRFITPDYLMKWIEDNGLLYLLFGPSDKMLNKNSTLIEGYIRINYENDQYLPFDVLNLIKLWYNEQCHASIMEQSVDVLKFICTESKLKMNHVEILWNILKRLTLNIKNKDNELSILCNVIDQLLFYLDPEHVTFLVSNIEKLELSLITAHHLSLISGASKVFNNIEMTEKCLNFLWNLVDDDNKCNNTNYDDVVDKAINLLCSDLVSKFGENFRTKFINKCMNNLKIHKSVFISLNVLRILLNLLEVTERYMMIGHLIDNEKLLKHYFNDITYFKKYVKQQIGDKNDNDDDENNKEIQELMDQGYTMYEAHIALQLSNNNDNDINNDNKIKLNEEINDLKLFGGKRTYLNEVKERIKFLKFLTKHYNHLILTDEERDILYFQFIHNALTNKERKIGILKLKNIIKSDDKYPMLQEQISNIDDDDDDDTDNNDDAHNQQQQQQNEELNLSALGYVDDDLQQQILLQSAINDGDW